MSGGSYNYLGHITSLHELLESRDALDRMVRRLAEITDAELVTRETQALIETIAMCDEYAQAAVARLCDVWLAVEWEDSNDGHPGQVEDALRRHADWTRP